MKSKNMVKTKRAYSTAQGSNAIWDGPLNMDNQPRGYGSSSGCKGIQLLAKNMPMYKAGPITEKAKGLDGEGMN
jgi:hypothetical protein|tara:strand:+ start:583 stop:804 length:222 start_codon:yes stop_codon:yes gene_type:complete